MGELNLVEPPVPGFQKFQSILADFGLGNPFTRFAAGAAVGTLAVVFFQPSVSYGSNGEARPWKLLNPNEPNGTYLPWWLLGSAPGILLALFL